MGSTINAVTHHFKSVILRYVMVSKPKASVPVKENLWIVKEILAMMSHFAARPSHTLSGQTYNFAVTHHYKVVVIVMTPAKDILRIAMTTIGNPEKAAETLSQPVKSYRRL